MSKADSSILGRYAVPTGKVMDVSKDRSALILRAKSTRRNITKRRDSSVTPL